MSLNPTPLQVRQMMYSSHYSSHAQHTHNLFSPTASSYSAHSPYITPHHPHPAPSPSPGSLSHLHIWHSHPNQAGYAHIRAPRHIRTGCHKAGFVRRCLFQVPTTTSTPGSPSPRASPTPPPTTSPTPLDLPFPPTSPSTTPPDEPDDSSARRHPVFPECSSWEKHDRSPPTWKDLDSLITGPQSSVAVKIWSK